MLRKIAWPSMVVAVSVAVSGSVQAEGLKLGALMPMTGTLQAYGETCLNGAKLAVEHMNAGGGVLGGKVELVVGDTQTSAQSGVDAAQKLVSITRVSGIVGALSSGVTGPVAKSVASVHGVPIISPSSTSPELTNMQDKGFLYRTVPSDAFQGVALAQVVNEKGIKDVAIVYLNNDYGKGLAEAFGDAFKKLGGKVTGEVAYEEKQASYRGELQKVAAGGSKTVVLIAYPEDGIPLVKQSLEGGYFSAFIFSDGLKDPGMVEAIGAQYLNGSFGTAPEAMATNSAAWFREAYEKSFGELPPKPYIDTSFDAVMLLGLAAVKAGSTDPKAIRDALDFVASPPGEKILPSEFAKGVKLLQEGKDIDYVGAAGSQDFDAAGDVPGTFAHWEIQNGKITTVKVFEPK